MFQECIKHLLSNAFAMHYACIKQVLSMSQACIKQALSMSCINACVSVDPLLSCFFACLPLCFKGFCNYKGFYIISEVLFTVAVSFFTLLLFLWGKKVIVRSRVAVVGKVLWLFNVLNKRGVVYSRRFFFLLLFFLWGKKL